MHGFFEGYCYIKTLTYGAIPPLLRHVGSPSLSAFIFREGSRESEPTVVIRLCAILHIDSQIPVFACKVVEKSLQNKIL